MPKVFITGGAGFVGSRVVQRFLSDGYDVTVYDTLKQYLPPDPSAPGVNLLARLADVIDRIKMIQGDTTNRDHLRRSLNAVRPDILVHMAALPLASVAIEQSEEAFGSILESTVNVLEVMRDFDHRCRLVYTSSSMVYGDFKEPKVAEDAPTVPKDIYGSFKLAGEVVVRGYASAYDLDTVIVRPSAVYGPFDANQRVLQKFVTKALRGEPLRVDGDGSARLDFTYVDDAAQGIHKVAVHPKASGETFNVTRGESRSLREAVDLIRAEVGEVAIEYGKPPAYMPERGTLDITKARTLVGYEPEYDLERGLQQYVAHLRSHPI